MHEPIETIKSGGKNQDKVQVSLVTFFQKAETHCHLFQAYPKYFHYMCKYEHKRTRDMAVRSVLLESRDVGEGVAKRETNISPLQQMNAQAYSYYGSQEGAFCGKRAVFCDKNKRRLRHLQSISLTVKVEIATNPENSLQTERKK